MVDVRCEPAEWTNTFRLLTTVKDDDEVDAGEDSVVIVLHDSAEQLQDSGIAEASAAESKRRRWREMPQHLRSSIDGSGHSSSVASVPGRGPRVPFRRERPPTPSSPSCRGRVDAGNVPSATATPDFLRCAISDSRHTTPTRSKTIADVEPITRRTLCRRDATCQEDDADDDVIEGDIPRLPVT